VVVRAAFLGPAPAGVAHVARASNAMKVRGMVHRRRQMKAFCLEGTLRLHAMEQFVRQSHANARNVLTA
jgi:hypothetical protein